METSPPLRNGLKKAIGFVRFHLGSGINGNIMVALPGKYFDACPLSSRKWN